MHGLVFTPTPPSCLLLALFCSTPATLVAARVVSAAAEATRRSSYSAHLDVVSNWNFNCHED